MQLTKNFSLAELIRSDTAIRLGHSEQFKPSEEIISNLKALAVNILQPLRDALGVPLRVTCGYRCPRTNKAVGGSATSEHMQGMAADIELWVDGKEYNQKLFDTVLRLNLPFTQMIDEFGTPDAPAWIHISYNPAKLKRQKLRADKIKGKTVYTII